MNRSTNTGSTTSANPAASAAAPGARGVTSENRNALIMGIVKIITAIIGAFVWNRRSKGNAALGGLVDQTEISPRPVREQSGVGPARIGARRKTAGSSANRNSQVGGHYHG